jgi:lipopolysaccharide transport system ATP-binding protein
MSEECVIRGENLSKAYTIWASPAARLHGPVLGRIGQTPFLPAPLRERFRRWAHESFKEFYALRDVSFTVQKGESLGVIGRNGSGKSTLLQIVAGTLRPTNGAVTLVGRVAALLELGSGFNPEFTGRENVYMNGAVLGLSRSEIDQRFADIEAFAGIGEFIDQPVKTYSSGMVVRLAFSVAARVSPDVLIVDEALSVGDAAFQQKCLTFIEAARRRGTTILFVSHDIHMVRTYCTRAIYLQAGRIVMDGGTEPATEAYLKDIVAERQASSSTTLEWKQGLKHGAGGFGDKRGEIAEVEFFSRDRGPAVTTVSYGDEVGIKITARVDPGVRNPSILCQLRDFRGYNISGVTSGRLGVRFTPEDRRSETVSAIFWWPIVLLAGQYTFTVGLNDYESPTVDLVIDRVFGVGPLIVLEGKPLFHGVVNLNARCEKTIAPPSADTPSPMSDMVCRV